MIIVSRDGSGDFTTIQEAIHSVTTTHRSPVIILVRMNEYKEQVVVDRDNIRIVGEARDRTIITWGNGTETAQGADGTFVVTGRNVEVENLTVRFESTEKMMAQTAAVIAAADRGVWRNCRLEAPETAVICGCPESASEQAQMLAEGRVYFENCTIQGSRQLVSGSSCAWFEGCTLQMLSGGGDYTAFRTPHGQAYGAVFHRCTLKGECGEGEAFLGELGEADAQAVFLDCEMDGHVAPSGFRVQSEDAYPTEKSGEYRTRGERSDLSERIFQEKRLSDDEASVYSVAEVLGGCDGWHPDRRVPTWYLCGDSTMANYPETASPMTGWGQMLQPLLKETIYVENCAICGRSSKSFIAEKWLGYIELCLHAGDKVIISFSHNDEKKDPLRYTSPFGTFPEYLSLYIDAARAHGAEPILATPIARRHFDSEGRLLATHGDYPEAMRNLAKVRGVRLVDMEKGTMQIVSQLGDQESRTLYCHVPAGHPNYPDGAQDNSHLHRRGAIRYAALFLSLLKGEITTDGLQFSEAGSDLTGLIAKEDSILR